MNTEASASATTALSAAREVIALALTPSRRNLLHWLSWLLAVSVVSGMTALLADGQVFGWEQALTRRAQALGMPGWLYRLAADGFIDLYGWQGALITLAIIFGLWLLRQRVAAVVLLLVFPLHALANFPKILIDRDRPSELFDGIFGVGGGMSFTSAHSEFVVTFYGFLVYLALRRLRSQAQRMAVILGWLFFVGLVGFGRVAHGNHWPLDAVGGYVAGAGALSGLIWLHTAFRGVAERRTA